MQQCKVLIKVGSDLHSKTFETREEADAFLYGAASGAAQAGEGSQDTFETYTIEDSDEGFELVKIDLDKVAWAAIKVLGTTADVETVIDTPVEKPVETPAEPEAPSEDTVTSEPETVEGGEAAEPEPVVSAAEGPNG